MKKLIFIAVLLALLTVMAQDAMVSSGLFTSLPPPPPTPTATQTPFISPLPTPVPYTQTTPALIPLRYLYGRVPK